MTIEKATDFTN